MPSKQDWHGTPQLNPGRGSRPWLCTVLLRPPVLLSRARMASATMRVNPAGHAATIRRTSALSRLTFCMFSCNEERFRGGRGRSSAGTANCCGGENQLTATEQLHMYRRSWANHVQLQRSIRSELETFSTLQRQVPVSLEPVLVLWRSRCWKKILNGRPQRGWYASQALGA